MYCVLCGEFLTKYLDVYTEQHTDKIFLMYCPTCGCSCDYKLTPGGEYELILK